MDLPIIGIIKEVYGDCSVYITPTIKEIDALVACGVSIIATDATDSAKRPRPDGRWMNFFARCVKSIRISCLWQTAPVMRRECMRPSWDLILWGRNAIGRER